MIKLSSTKDWSQESLLGTIGLIIISPWLFFIGLTSLVVLQAKIHSWKESKMSPTEKIRRKLKGVIEWIDEIAGSKEHWDITFRDNIADVSELSTTKKNPRNAALGVISIETFEKYGKKLADSVKELASITDAKDALKKIDENFKAKFKKDDFIYENNKPVGFNYETKTIKWPNDPYYKDTVKCVERMATVIKGIKSDFEKVIAICDKIIEADASKDDKKVVANKVAFVTTADTYANLAVSMHYAWEDNINRVLDIDITRMKDKRF